MKVVDDNRLVIEVDLNPSARASTEGNIVMNNVYRADYVECLVAAMLGTDWWLTWVRGWD